MTKLSNTVLSALFFVLLSSSSTHADTLKVFFLNVGEGEAIYIETPDKKKALIDTGNPITGFRVVRFLKERSVDELDVIIITHPHLDHMGGVFQVLQHLNAESRYDNGQPISDKGSDDIYRWYKDFYRKGNYEPLKAGDQIVLGRTIINVLSPLKMMPNWNSNSLVLKIVFGRTSFLLMGDATIIIEEVLMKEPTNLKSDVLKIGHHGAIDASDNRFLEIVAPEFAVISVNENNVRGYPSPEVVRKIEDRGIKLFFTWRDGDIVFESDGSTIKKLEHKKTGEVRLLLNSSFSFEDSSYGFKENYNIKPQVPVSHIPGVKGNSLFIGRVTPATYLPESSNSRRNTKT